ncbi:transcriptional regulator, LysR family [Streptomyces xiamenensis]|uniref:Transcriptional regulator, LysR family n=1 Tax=Streptomyces xiamenensis TaxID=408015 RepID=A0A0F7FUU4_9ACTN|nr:transcriptional regulator, LysR family [Streptomyces xiamenensis]
MDTRLLHTFTTLARTGSFTATAAELHLAQSTVTVHIRTLEREPATPLFDRLPAGTVLTDPGRRLLERAGDVLDAVARLRAGRSVAGPPVPDVPVQLARHSRRWTSPAADAFAGLLRAAAP